MDFLKTCLIIIFLTLSLNIHAQTCVEARYLKEVGVREATGNNDGKDVEKYLKSVGQTKGASWCAAFVHWVLEQCGIVTSITAWSPSALNKNNLVWFDNKWYKTPKAGDVFVLYSQTKKRIAHTGFFHRKLSETTFETVEGNAAPEGAKDSFNGVGIFKKKRSFHATYAISRWVD